MTTKPTGPSGTYETFGEAFEQALRRLRAASPSALAGVAVLSTAVAIGCGPDPSESTTYQETTGTGVTGGVGGVTGGAGGTGGATAGSGGAGGTGGATAGSGGAGGTGGATAGSGGATSTGGDGGGTAGMGGSGAMTGDGGTTDELGDPCGSADPGMAGGVSDPVIAQFTGVLMEPGKITLKVRVKPVPGADPASKDVHFTFRKLAGHDFNDWDNYLSEEVSVVAQLAAALPEGYEEWHATVEVPFVGARHPLFLLRAWYNDGAGNLYFDDNHGELHAVHCLPGAFEQPGAFPDCTISRDPTGTQVTVTDAGIQGHIEALAPRLDADNTAVVKWTTDNWATVHEAPMTLAGTNGCYLDRWTLDLDVPGTFTAIKYVLEYRHGVVNGATPASFWDDNGGIGYIVLK